MTKNCKRYFFHPSIKLLLLLLLRHASTVSAPALPRLPRDRRPLLPMYLPRALIDLHHRLGVRKPDLPIRGGRARALPLRAMARHGLPMRVHVRGRRAPGPALGRDERGRGRGVPARGPEARRERADGLVPLRTHAREHPPREQ